MVAFGHTAVGTLVGLSSFQYFGTSDPIKGIIITTAVAITSHYIADFIPHGHFFKFKDFKSKIFAVIIFDLLISLLLFTYLSYLKFDLSLPLVYILFGIGGSQLPDVIDGLIYIGFLPKSGLIKIENNFHQLTHWHGRKEKTLLISPWDLWQVGVVLFAVYQLLII